MNKTCELAPSPRDHDAGRSSIERASELGRKNNESATSVRLTPPGTFTDTLNNHLDDVGWDREISETWFLEHLGTLSQADVAHQAVSYDVPDHLPGDEPKTHTLYRNGPAPNASLAEDDDELLLHVLRTEMLQYFPFAHIPKDLTAKQLQRTRPFFFDCIRCVTTSSKQRKQRYEVEIKQTLSQRLIFENQASIDLLLGLLTFTAWKVAFYNPCIRLCTIASSRGCADWLLGIMTTSLLHPRPCHTSRNSPCLRRLT